MKKILLSLTTVALVSAVAVLAQGKITISGKQIRGVPGRNAQLISTGVKLARAGTVVEAVSGGDGFWIEDDMGVVNEYRDPRKAVGTPLDAGGPYRVYPFLKKGQNEASAYINLTVP